MVRVVDFNQRRDEILKATIELYLETAQPVSSDILIDRYKFDLSSATVRNVLKDLEGMGLLMQPHTSAGRIPTGRGYRYYINELMPSEGLKEEEKAFIVNFFESASAAGSEGSPLYTAMKILTDITHYVGLLNLDGEHRIRYKGLNYLLDQPEFDDIQSIRSIIRLLEEDGLLGIMERKLEGQVVVMIGDECPYPEMMPCSLIISECPSGRRSYSKFGVLGPKRMAYNKVIPIVNYLSELIAEEL